MPGIIDLSRKGFGGPGIIDLNRRGLQVYQPKSSGFRPTDVPKAEANALMSFYNATDGDNWTTNTGWGTNRTVGEWFGVTVSGGHVTVISLGDNNLDTDSVPIDLTDLQLTAAGVDAVLSDMVTSAGTGGTINVSGTNAAPTGDGITAAETLVNDSSWTVTMSATEEEEVLSSAYIATKDGEAMFFADGEDFSEYAEGSYLIRFIDSAGKVADAYAGEAGGGEKLGSNLVPNGDMELDSNWTIWNDNGYITNTRSSEQANSGTYSRKHVVTDDEGENRGMVSDNISIVEGRLYKVGGYSYDIPTSLVRSDATVLPAIVTLNPNSVAGWVGNFNNFTALKDSSTFTIRTQRISTNTFFFDDISIKLYTDIPATGLKLVSTSGGSTRNLANIESGFNPNDITTIQVWSV